MLARILSLLLFSSTAFAAGPPFLRSVPGNCSTPSAACLFANPTITGALTISGTTGPQIDSTGTSPLEVRSRAANGTDNFRFYGHNSLTSGFHSVWAEKAGTTAEVRMSLDYRGGLLVYSDAGAGGDIGAFGAFYTTNGGSDSPIILRGGPATSANTSRTHSFQTGTAVQQANIRAAGGNFQQLGQTTAALVACNGSAAYMDGWDTTLGKPVMCDGNGTWRQYASITPFDGTQNPGSIAAQTCTDFTITATGVVDADVLICDRPAGLEAGLLADCTSGVDVVGWRVCNITAGAIDPANGTYRARLIR